MGRDTGRANFPSSSRRVANILAESTTLNECPLGRALRHGSVQARDLLFYRGAGVPPRADRQQDAQARVPEPPLIGHVRGKPRRWVVERTNSWHNSFRGLRTRWERKVERYGALVELACAIIIKPSRERPTGHDGSLLAPLSPLVRILGSTSERGFSSHLGRPVYTDAAQWSLRKLFIGVRSS